MLPTRTKLKNLPQHVDMLVIGGGITGAGVALLAAQQGLRVLLVEQKDYAWGTSSRSSKMVHGGLRYLAQGAVGLTRESLREREILINELPGLVQRHSYLFPVYKKQFPGRWAMGAALMLYDWFAGVRDHQWLPLKKLQQQLPFMAVHKINGAMRYTDAATDDSRLVLRVLQEACAEGAEVINYVQARSIEAINSSDGSPAHSEVTLVDALTQEERVITANHVVNATGTWADELSAAAPKIRPLRGSHLIFAAHKLPVNYALALLHPVDKRLIFVFPWYGHTVVGTTDLDHTQPKFEEAYAEQEEIDYLLQLIKARFPHCNIDYKDIISTQAGVRPIIRSGKDIKPSEEDRGHLVWQAPGRITVSGGKLTTFRIMGLDVLLAAGLIDKREYKRRYRQKTLFRHEINWPTGLGHLDAAQPITTADTATLQAWWHWAIHKEQVVHLDDLMLRRTHIGNLTPDGGQALLTANQAWLQQQLGWDNERWASELARYLQIWQGYYQPKR
ncbi:glycerol-3-phosphate dehydrogenase/oxidase [Aliidiomarina quisquiliarum]|uniref:glycerol-3-phosphate dehydrogenase/oxidase n=1 Tax=Aliidiomarina quisquiliarum TaxID=2938947 RepID=UPI00208F9033|nr:glycerol-3-phosphate dehydrogenase/oxidase [Aliidiomarina quisquiliarum]MCO4320999.1 glycerol-3-phosphate dehydrogenase/oxidase [Aliidiomarina quisquiliarum]